MKKIVISLFVVVILAVCLPVVSDISASENEYQQKETEVKESTSKEKKSVKASGTDAFGYVYELDDTNNTAVLTGNTPNYRDLIIPTGYSFDTVSINSKVYDLVEIKATNIFNSMILENISFANLTTISGSNAFTSSTLTNVKMPALKGINSTGTYAFQFAKLDDKTIISIDEIKGSYWFKGATLNGTKFSNLTKISGNNAFYEMKGGISLSFPKLKDISGTSSFRGSTISNVEFSALESISGTLSFYEATLSNVQMPVIKGENSSGTQVFGYAVMDSKTIISIDEIKGAKWFYDATIKGSEFPNLTKISGADAFAKMKEGTTSLEFPELVEISGMTAFGYNSGKSGKASINSFKFPKLKDITGSFAFRESLISDVQMASLKGSNSSGGYAFYSAIMDDKTIISIDEIKGANWFNQAIIKGSKFPNLTKISGSRDFYQMREGTTSLEFPELVEISGPSVFEGNNGKSGRATITDSKFPKLKDIKGQSSFRDSAISNVEFSALESISGTLSFYQATLSNVQMPLLKGNNSTGDQVFADAVMDDKTIISIDEIKGTKWFYMATIKGSEFPNLTKISGSDAFYLMKEGTTGLEFPELVEISGGSVFAGNNGKNGSATITDSKFPKLKDIKGHSSFRDTAISNVQFSALESISGTLSFYEATLSNVQMSLLKGNNSTGMQVFGSAVMDDKTIISIDEIKGTKWFYRATIKGSKFPNLTKISGDEAFYQMREGTTSLEFPELVEINRLSAFAENSGISGSATITGFKFPKLKDIKGHNTFFNSVISNVQFPVLETISGSSNFRSSIITTGEIEFPKLKSITSSNNFYSIPTLMNISLGAQVPITGNPNFVNGGAGKYLTTPTDEDQKGYILDDQDGKAADGLWFGFKTHDAVVFDSNGGSETVVELVDKTTKKVNKPVIPTKDNHHFEGWFYEDGTEFTFDESGKSENTVEGTITVKAKWSKNYYTLKYNSNGGVGVMADVNIDQGEQVTVLNSTFTKEGYTFSEWNTKQNGLEGTLFSPGDSLNPDVIPDTILSRIWLKDINLHAQWKPNTNTKYIVKHMKQNIEDDNYSLFETENLTGTTDTVVTATKKNYVGFTPETGTVTETIAADGSLVLEVKYDRNKFDVNFESNGALTAPESLTQVKYESIITEPSDVTKTGYTLNGWFTEEIFENEWNFSTSKVTSDTTLYAKWEANTYKVEFDATTGLGAMLDQTFTYDQAQNLTLNTFVKDNFTFVGWKIALDGTGDIITDGQSVENLATTGTIKLYAQWSQDYHKVNYHANSGTGVMNSIDLNHGTTLTIPTSEFTKTNSSFTHWNTEKDNSGTTYNVGDILDPLTLTKLQKGEINLYAQWSQNFYTISYDENTGSGVMEPVNVNQGDTLTVPDTLFTKVGYEFSSWNTKSDNSGETYNVGDTLDPTTVSRLLQGNITLFAQWTESLDTKYKVIHEKQNLADDNYSTFETENLTGTTNDVVTAIKKDYVGFTPKLEEIIGTIAPDGSLVLVVKYDRNKFDVNFESNGALTTPEALTSVKYESIITEPSSVSKPGYTLNGWFTEETFENKWNFSTSIVTSNTTLYAKWEANSYTVEFDGALGLGTMLDQTFTYDQAQELTLNTFVKDNFTFVGWNTALDGTGTNYADGQPILNVLESGSIKLYAQWSQDFHKVNYHSNSGTGVMNSVNVNHGSTLVVPDSQFTKANSSFINWNTDVDGNGTTYNAGDTLDPLTLTKIQQGEITLFAQWSQNFFTISYDENTGNGVMEPVNVNQGDTLTVPDTLFTKLGYEFTSWNTALDGSGTTYNAGDTLDPTTVSRLLQGEITLFAQWKANNYTVEFNANQGEGVMANQNFTYDLADNLNLNKFTRKGYTFVGWNTIANATTGNLTDGQSISNLVTNGSVTLYAKWKANNYTVEFNSNSGIGTMDDQIFEYDVNKVLTTNTFTKEDYTFVGWNTKEDGTGVDYIDGQNIINMLTSGTQELYAKWELTSTELEPSVPTTPQVPLDPSTDVIKPTKPVVEEELEDTGVTTNILIYLLFMVIISTIYALRKRKQLNNQ